MNVSSWGTSDEAIKCYTIYRNRIEAEDKWIIARVQTTIFCQGFLFTGLSIFVRPEIFQKNLGNPVYYSIIGVAVLGMVIGYIGFHGVNAAITAINRLVKDYRKTSEGLSAESAGLPYLTSDDDEIHQPVLNRANLLMASMFLSWLVIAVLAFRALN